MSTSATDRPASSDFTRRLARFYRGPALFALVLAVASLVWVIPASIRVMATNSNNVADWLPADSNATKDLTWFIEHFGSDEILVISWPGCTLDDPRLPRLATALLEYRYPARPDLPSPFRQVLTGPETIDRLMAEPVRLTRDQATERMKGWLVGPDGQASCAVALLSDVGLGSRRWAKWAVEQTAQSVCDIAPDELRIGGGSADSAAIDEASSRHLYAMAGASFFISVLIAWWSLRNWLLTLLVFADATYSLGLTLTIMDATGQTMNSMLIIVPALVYVLAISASIHFANYFRESVRQTTADLAAARTAIIGWTPCVLAAATTAIGLGSLARGELVPIRQFAIYSSAGVLVATAVLLLLFPAALQLFSGPVIRSINRQRQQRLARSGHRRYSMKSQLTRLVVAWHRPIVVAGIVVMAVSAYGARRVESAFDIQSLFRPDAPIVRNYHWLEQQLGPLVPVEIVLRFANDSELSALDQLTLVRKVQRGIEKIDAIGATISPATFMPDLPQGGGARLAAARSVYRRRLPEYQQQLRDVGFLAETDQEQLWRITARVTALANVDYAPVLEQLKATVKKTIRENRHNADISFTVCGGVPLIHSAQRQILDDLRESFITALLLITLAVIVILRNVRGGLLMMLPNVFPVLIIFGAMGWLGINVDIGGMMTASVALGIAVDDTLHFLTWFQRSRDAGHGRRTAVVAGLRRCTAAMTQTTAVCALGLLAFSASDFVPISRFSWLMAAALVAALLGDLLFLPALLVSQLGRVFHPTRRNTAA